MERVELDDMVIESLPKELKLNLLKAVSNQQVSLEDLRRPEVIRHVESMIHHNAIILPVNAYFGNDAPNVEGEPDVVIPAYKYPIAYGNSFIQNEEELNLIEKIFTAIHGHGALFKVTITTRWGTPPLPDYEDDANQ